MTHIYENRWYTKTGKRKRIPKALEVFRPLIWINSLGAIDENYLGTSLLGKSPTFRVIVYNPYIMELLKIFLNGVFSNRKINSSYRVDNYEAGREYAKMIAAYLTFDQTGWEKL